MPLKWQRHRRSLTTAQSQTSLVTFLLYAFTCHSVGTAWWSQLPLAKEQSLLHDVNAVSLLAAAFCQVDVFHLRWLAQLWLVYAHFLTWLSALLFALSSNPRFSGSLWPSDNCTSWCGSFQLAMINRAYTFWSPLFKVICEPLDHMGTWVPFILLP